MSNTSCGAIDVYDNGNGSAQVVWPAFGGPAPDSYNVYLNGALNQNVAIRKAIIAGLAGASYNGATVTPATTYTVRIAAVKAGIETAASLDRKFTAQPTSIMLKTPMRRPFPFPNTGLD